MKHMMIFLMLAGMGLTACDDGPAEEFGQDVDDAVDESIDETRDAFDELEDDIDRNL